MLRAAAGCRPFLMQRRRAGFVNNSQHRIYAAFREVEPATVSQMQEIRICHKLLTVAGETVMEGLWMRDSPQARSAFIELVKAGNEEFGAGSHWLEERESELRD